MRPPRPFRLVPLLVALAAACGDGASEPIARPHELRLEIVRGKGMRVPVRPVDAPASQVIASGEPVIVRVSALVGAGVQALPGATGPALAVRLPPVELRWRALEPWCHPLHAVTPLVNGDTVHNFYVRPTTADGCLMVVDGVSGSWVFDSDTAFVRFDAGPPVSVTFPSRLLLTIDLPPVPLAVLAEGTDAYGNSIADLPLTVVVTEGASLFHLTETHISATAEGTGAVRLTSGSFSEIVEAWGLPWLQRRQWRVAWTCYGFAVPGAASIDSARFVVDSAQATYGAPDHRGFAIAVTGRLTRREWRPGEPERVTVAPGYPVLGTLQALAVEWSAGQVAQRTQTGYAGGSLCGQTAEGAAWTRGGPARMDAL